MLAALAREPVTYFESALGEALNRHSTIAYLSPIDY